MIRVGNQDALTLALVPVSRTRLLLPAEPSPKCEADQ